jgi:hypothetical protein
MLLVLYEYKDKRDTFLETQHKSAILTLSASEALRCAGGSHASSNGLTKTSTDFT